MIYTKLYRNWFRLCTSHFWSMIITKWYELLSLTVVILLLLAPWSRAVQFCHLFSYTVQRLKKNKSSVSLFVYVKSLRRIQTSKLLYRRLICICSFTGLNSSVSWVLFFITFTCFLRWLQWLNLCTNKYSQQGELLQQKKEVALCIDL